MCECVFAIINTFAKVICYSTTTTTQQINKRRGLYGSGCMIVLSMWRAFARANIARSIRRTQAVRYMLRAYTRKKSVLCLCTCPSDTGQESGIISRAHTKIAHRNRSGVVHLGMRRLFMLTWASTSRQSWKQWLNSKGSIGFLFFVLCQVLMRSRMDRDVCSFISRRFEQ